MSNLKNFRCIPCYFSNSEKHAYHLYYKIHTINDSNPLNLENNRTIFVCNIPAYLSDEHLIFIFQSICKVKKIIRWGTQGDLEIISQFNEISQYLTLGYKNAYIIFNEDLNNNSFDLLFKLFPFKLYEHFNNFSIVKNKEITDIDNLSEVLSKYANFKVKNKSKVMDSEGWTTYDDVISLPNLPFEPKMKEKETAENHLELYSFRRKKIQEEKILNLRRKFEEDKAKVAKMKRKRVFEPNI